MSAPKSTTNSEHHRYGDAVSELMPWLSADAGKSKPMVVVPILALLHFKAADERSLTEVSTDYRSRRMDECYTQLRVEELI